MVFHKFIIFDIFLLKKRYVSFSTEIGDANALRDEPGMGDGFLRQWERLSACGGNGLQGKMLKSATFSPCITAKTTRLGRAAAFQLVLTQGKQQEGSDIN